MGRGIIHRKVMQNKRRESHPEHDHLVAGAVYGAPRVEIQPPNPDHETVTLTRGELAALLARVNALESVQPSG